jgi:GntR family transcriptional regulator / MocR family aminotransferase
VIEFAFRPDRASDVPVYRQLGDHLAAFVDTGRLAPGAKLPASRDLAATLGLARNTVTAAYEWLAVRGLVTSHVGQGTFVVAAGARALPARTGPAAAAGRREFAWAGLFARGPRVGVPGGLRRSEAGGPVSWDFRGGRIAATALPIGELRSAFARPFTGRGRLADLARHQDPFGWPPLRREVARLLAGRGVACAPEDVAIVTGIQHAAELAARVLVDPGDAVAIEQPGYFGAALAFAARQAALLGVDVDEEGIRVDRLARALRLRRVKLLYVTPATQNPTGVTLSPARREALLGLADEHQMPVFEDDYDSDLRYAGPPVAALKASDAAGQIVYAGTFSKVLFPSLRVGYVVAAPPLLERMVTARWLADFGTGVVEQAALASLLRSGGLERHLKRVRRLYAGRLAAMLAALEGAMPEGTRWTRPRSGHLVWVTLPPRIDAARLLSAALAAGVGFTPGEVFHVDGRGGDCLALSFTAVDEAAIGEGVARLGAIVREQAVAAGSRAAGATRAAARRSATRPRPAASRGGTHATR